MLLEHVFRAADRVGVKHGDAVVAHRVCVLQDAVEAPGSAVYARRECAGADGGGEYGDDASGLWVCGGYAGAELYAEA